MAPRSVWNLGLRPQPARPLAGAGPRRATSRLPIGRRPRPSSLRAPHEPRRFGRPPPPPLASRDLPAEWGRGRARGGAALEGARRAGERRTRRRRDLEASPNREGQPREAAPRIGCESLSVRSSPPSTSRPAPASRLRSARSCARAALPAR